MYIDNGATDMWNTILTPAEIEASHACTAQLDPAFAARDRAWYQARTANELRSAMVQAWNCSEAGAYQMACSYLAKLEA
jgi:hypothetical protein